MEDIEEEIEHQEFMDYIHHLEEQIFLAHVSKPQSITELWWYEIKTYGDEPVFAGLVFDRLIEEEAKRESD